MHGVSRQGALVLLSAACGDGRPDGWSEETHGKSAKPAYDVVLPAEPDLDTSDDLLWEGAASRRALLVQLEVGF